MIDPERAKAIRLVGFDIDGVMTDAGAYIGATTRPENDIELKRYDIQDGVGMALLAKAGIRLAIVTGRVSRSVTVRAKELGIEDVTQDPDAYKLPGFLSILSKRGITESECAYLGDDIPDLPILRRVGLPVAVGNATEPVRRECAVNLTRIGGHGAIREFAELLLAARGELERVVNEYVAERSVVGPKTS